jgi:hypothetical protein
MSGPFGKAHASDVTLKDVCPATSAAPTYFKPHLVEGTTMQIAKTQMLSVGTAGADTVRLSHQAKTSGLKWAPELPLFIITVQERTAATQAQRMLGKDRYLRINHSATPGVPAFENMDLANDGSRALLLDAAAKTARSAYRKNRAFVDRILSRRP